MITLVCAAAGLNAQTASDWQFVRPDNTGLGGDYNATVTGDHFGNIWLGGYMPTEGQGSVVRLQGNGVFTNWGTYDGYIPDGQVQAITFDDSDYLWVGTTAGIARYNSTIWTKYDASNSPLQMDGVAGMAVGKSNEIWAVVYRYSSGLGSDLVHFNGTGWSLDTAGQPTPDLYSLAIDSAGNKWMGSAIGLLKYDGTSWVQYTDTNSAMTGSTAYDVQVDSLNRIWCTSGGAIDIFDGTAWSHINSWPNPNFHADYFYTRGNRLIVADYNSWDVLIQNGAGWISHRAPGWISDTYIDTNGHYWVAGQGFVSKFDGTQWKDYTRYNSGLTEYFNNDVFVDSKNRKWFANGNGGIQVFDCPKWEAYGPMNGGLYPSPQTLSTVGTCVTEDSYGDIWMTYDGTFGYAVQIPGGNYSNYAAWKYWNDTTVGMPNFQSIQQVAATTDGKVFFRSYYGDIFMFDHATNTWTSYSNGSGLNVYPEKIAAGLNGKMYVTGYGSMDEFSNGTWTNIDLNSLGAPVTFINDIAFDSARNMWLATNEGVWKYDSTAGAWQHWDESNSDIAADHVTSIEISKKTGQVFVGAHNTSSWPYYGGMSVLNGTTWTSFLQDSSLIPHKQVEDVALDTLGNIWILAQSEGIAVYKQGGVAGFGCINRSLQLRQFIPTPTGVAHAGMANADFSVYPNPISGQGTLSFTLPQRAEVRIGLYDMQGRFVRELYKGTVADGAHRITWSSKGVSPGIYTCRFTTAHSAALQKIIVQ